MRSWGARTTAFPSDHGCGEVEASVEKIPRRLFFYWFPALFWIGIVLWIGTSTAIPMKDGDVIRWLVRKAIHVGEYAVLSFLFYRALAPGVREYCPGRSWLALLFAVAFGGFDEWRQLFIPRRSGQLTEVGTDPMGAVLGQVGVWAERRLLSRWPHLEVRF